MPNVLINYGWRQNTGGGGGEGGEVGEGGGEGAKEEVVVATVDAEVTEETLTVKREK